MEFIGKNVSTKLKEVGLFVDINDDFILSDNLPKIPYDKYVCYQSRSIIIIREKLKYIAYDSLTDEKIWESDNEIEIGYGGVLYSEYGKQTKYKINKETEFELSEEYEMTTICGKYVHFEFDDTEDYIYNIETQEMIALKGFSGSVPFSVNFLKSNHHGDSISISCSLSGKEIYSYDSRKKNVKWMGNYMVVFDGSSGRSEKVYKLVRKQVKHKKIKDNEFDVTISSNYAIFLEFGTSRIQPRPFIRPGIEKIRKRLGSAITAIRRKNGI
jgi:HK97 gp10 family phage protein